MIRTRSYLLILLALLVALAGCTQATPQVIEKEVPVEKIVTAVVERQMMSQPALAPAAAPTMVASYAAGESVADMERMIIRTGSLSLLVSDTNQAMESIAAIVTELQGYIVDSNARRSNDHVSGNMTVRVPAASFDAAMERIKAVANVVRNTSTSGEDVTEEYADLDARLRTLEATENELLELLTQVRERTGKAEDILAVYRELTSIRSQIESLKGRMQYLSRMTAMATINIALEPDIVDQPLSGDTQWRPSATFSSALKSLVGTLQFLGKALIWLVVYVVPILILILLPLAALVWVINRLRRRKKTAA